MSTIFRVEYVRKSKKEIKWFDSKEEAIDCLMEVAAQEAIDTIPHNGALRTKAFQEAVPKYLDKIENIESSISLWVPPQKK